MGGGAGVFDQLDDFDGDFGEGGDVGDGVDGIGDDRLGVFFDQGFGGDGGRGGGGGWGGWGGWGVDMKHLLVNRSAATAQKVHGDYRWFSGSA